MLCIAAIAENHYIFTIKVLYVRQLQLLMLLTAAAEVSARYIAMCGAIIINHAVPLSNSSQLYCFLMMHCTSAPCCVHNFFMLSSCSVAALATGSWFVTQVPFLMHNYHLPVQLLCCFHVVKLLYVAPFCTFVV